MGGDKRAGLFCQGLELSQDPDADHDTLFVLLLAGPIDTVSDASHQGFQFPLFHLQQETEVCIALQKTRDDFNQLILRQILFRLFSLHFRPMGDG